MPEPAQGLDAGTGLGEGVSFYVHGGWWRKGKSGVGKDRASWKDCGAGQYSRGTWGQQKPLGRAPRVSCGLLMLLRDPLLSSVRNKACDTSRKGLVSLQQYVICVQPWPCRPDLNDGTFCLNTHVYKAKTTNQTITKRWKKPDPIHTYTLSGAVGEFCA